MIGALMPYSTCFCHRDFTVDEFKYILKELRKRERLPTDTLWKPKYSTGATPDDVSFERTVQELNRVMKKYNINTCLRKIHFLAQAYHETDRFRSTQEYDSIYTPKYDPWRGRGLIHLTHSSAYKNFSNDMNDEKILTSNGTIVATDIKYSYESGGWFWEKGKVFSHTPLIWKYKGTNQKIISENAECEKNITTYGNSSTQIPVIDLNLLADNDWKYTISYLVNSGENGIDERVSYSDMLKEIMKYEICKNHK